VKDVIRGRELLSLEALGVKVQLTCHLPDYKVPGTQIKLRETKTTGVLLLPGLLSPRSATGDSAVYWADSFAKRGYKSFRVDLPGSCDSGGDAPAELATFINSGGYEAVTVEILKQITVRYDLSSVVMMGHCSGAVTALFAAGSFKDCRGLVLTEPYFYLQPPGPTRVREALSDWASRNRLGGMFSNLFDRLKELRLRVRRSEFPVNANIPLIKRWSSLVSAGLPILVFNVPGAKASAAKPRLGEFDYLEHLISLAGSRSRVDLEVVEGAGHSFADPVGRVAVRRATEKWLGKYFPSTIAEPSLLQDPEFNSMEANIVTSGAPVAAYVSSGEMGAI
jgi:hypothetical protein